MALAKAIHPIPFLMEEKSRLQNYRNIWKPLGILMRKLETLSPSELGIRSLFCLPEFNSTPHSPPNSELTSRGDNAPELG